MSTDRQMYVGPEFNAGQNFQTRPTRPDPSIYEAFRIRPDPTSSPIHDGKSCKINNELNDIHCYVHIPTNAPHKFETLRHAHVFTGWWSVQHACPSEDNWILTQYQTPPLCSQIDCTYIISQERTAWPSSTVIFHIFQP